MLVTRADEVPAPVGIPMSNTQRVAIYDIPTAAFLDIATE